MTAQRQLNAPTDVVVLEERATPSGHTLAIATLNFEKTLNSLSLPMIEILAPQLARWNAREDVVAVLLRGAGERAFCAGGDIQALYHGMTRNHAAKLIQRAVLPSASRPGKESMSANPPHTVTGCTRPRLLWS